MRVILARAVALGGAAVAAAVALRLILGTSEEPLDVTRGLLVVLATFWLAFGAVLGLMGLGRVRETPAEAPFQGRAVILVPIVIIAGYTMFIMVFLGTTLLGVTGLWPAILADTGATVLVTLNALRLLRWRFAAPVAP